MGALAGIDIRNKHHDTTKIDSPVIAKRCDPEWNLCILFIVGVNRMKIGSKFRMQRADGRNPWVVRVSSLLCLLLLTLVTFVQVVHVHPANTDADHCPICVVMHSAAPVAAVAAAIVFVRASAPVPVPVVHTVVRPWHCTLFNRPPPTEA
jgi:hypothetical protein